MVVCDSCRRELTKDDNRVMVIFEHIPAGWMRSIVKNTEIILCPECDKSVMNFIRNRVPREESR